MFKAPLYILVMVFFALNIRSQGSIQKKEIEGGTTLNVIYRKDYSGEIYIHTRGMGALFRKSKHVTSQQRNYFEVDVSNLKHPKEVKVVGEALDRKRFVYGKLNNTLLLKAAVGSQKVFYSKADVEAVEVRYAYSIGPILSFLKPYYVQVYRTNQYNQYGPIEVKYNEETFTIDSIVGRATFFKGFDETKIYPGLSGKFNLSFEYANYTNIIRAIELGFCLDYFPKALPIMARNPDENIVVTVRVGFVFGRRYY